MTGKRVSVTNFCFATDGKNKSWWTCCLMTHWNNDWQGREREGEREGERGREDVYERINFNVSYEMWKFLLTDFSKLN